MPPTKIETVTGSIREGTHRSKPQEITYQPAFVESPFILASLWRLIQERRREPKITVPREYYRGEATLPVSDMPPLVRDLRTRLEACLKSPSLQLFRSPHNPLKSKIFGKITSTS